MMKDDPLPIILKVGAKPVAAHNPVPVPLHWEDKVKRDLDRDEALNVIEKVPLTV